MPMTQRSLACLNPKGFHAIAYTEWGAPGRPALVCVHGMTRNGRDFDALAAALEDDWRVVCPDVVGRGRSDWLPDPGDYGYPQYLPDMTALIARLDVESVDWVGTSMGGLIGMGVSALGGTPVSRLVLNDVGPTIQPDAIKRIGAYLGAPVRWKTVDEAADYMWSISQGFGPHTREQWLALARPMLVPDGDGFKPHYDPAISVPFKAITPELAAAGEAALWAGYDRIACPTLLLRGADSDLLTRETAQAMTRRGPKARLIEFDGVGHAPTLVADDQVAAVREFLLAP